MKSYLSILALAALLSGMPAMAGTVYRGAPLIAPNAPRIIAPSASVAGSAGTVIDSVGFIDSGHAFSSAIDVTRAGTLTVKLSGISWLDALQNLNVFFTTASGSVIGQKQNGGFDTVTVQPGLVYVNWYGQPASGPLSLGVYSLSCQFQPTAPVPLPPGLLLMISGLAVLALTFRRAAPRQAAPS